MRAGYVNCCGRVLLSLILLSYGTSVPPSAWGGGPLVVGGTFGASGQPFTWDLSAFPNGQIPYRTDGGTLGNLSNAQANALVQSMFQVWQDVPTSNIAFTRLGQIQLNGVDTDIQTATDFNAVACPSSGTNANENPIIYDSTGSLFTSLGFSSNVIGFASPARLSAAGRITCGLAALNGRFLTSGTLSQDAFAAAFIHEFGHFSGLDHSQINLNCLANPSSCALDSDDAKGLPTMFPILLDNVMETVTSGNPPVSTQVPAQKTLAADDIAWISRLYPETLNNPPAQVPFSSQYGTISGSVFFSDGITGAQGVNVIARQQLAERRIAVSVVSGYAFTVGIGNPVLCPGLISDPNNPACPSTLGSRDLAQVGRFDIPATPGTYTLDLESVGPDFVGGSSVGPLSPPIPMPGSPPATPTMVTVAAGNTATVPDIVLQNTPARFDAFESAANEAPDRQPLWERKERLLQQQKEAA
jgi:hypothetical protein